MHALLFEPKAHGHRQVYVESLLRGLARQPASGALSLLVHPELLARLDPSCLAAATHRKALEPDELAALEAPDMLRRRWHQAALAARHGRRLGADHLHFLFLDDLLPLLALGRGPSPLAGFTVSGILFRPTLHYRHEGAAEERSGWPQRLDGAIRAQCLRLALRSPLLRAVMSLDRLLPAFAARHLEGGHKVVFLPEPFTPPQAAPLPAPAARRRLLMFGHISARKGILELLEAMARLDARSLARCRLTIIGRLDDALRPTVSTALARLRERAESEITLIERFVDDDELHAALCDSEIILAPYQRHVGSSGVLSLAAHYGRPILTQSSGLVGLLTRRHRLGLTCETGDPVALAVALRDAITAPFESLASSEGMAAFLREAPPERYAPLLLEAMGLLNPGPADRPAAA